MTSFMRGLVVIGSGPDAHEALVTERLRASAGGSALTAAVMYASADGRSAFEVAAPPLVAARHAGTVIEPQALLVEARQLAEHADFVVIATSGGLLGPLALRYTNRDLARELRLPIVLAVRASDGFFNHAMLTLESAAGAGLPVAAVVVTGWPEPPNRVLLDERALLEQAAGIETLTLEDHAGPWPVGEWLERASVPAAVADPAGAPPPEPVRVTLEPYRAWKEHPTGDPRATPRPQIMAVMLDIVAAEGPMRASRAYAVYNRASGGKKLTSVARAPLSSAIYWLAREGKVTLTRSEEIPWQGDDLVRMPDSPAVRVRELGPRALEEVPLDEIAELAARLRAARGTDDPTELKRAILSTYGLVRLTTRADEYLTLALDL